jgi:ketosteroid isomerase-like protein
MLAACLTFLAAAPAPAGSPDPETLARQVEDTERAFARTMADRDHEAFKSFLADEAVFFSDATTALRGAQAVADAWQAFFVDPRPPFSWEPEVVQVLESGTLALSSGPVRNPDGEVVGTFSSIWRQESPGTWRIVFDRGNPVCK